MDNHRNIVVFQRQKFSNQMEQCVARSKDLNNRCLYRLRSLLDRLTYIFHALGYNNKVNLDRDPGI